MKIYWDLSEKERSELTHEDVEKLIDAELMTQGVLRAKKPVLEPEPEAPKPKRTWFRIKRDPYHELNVAFETIEDAHQFIALRPVMVEQVSIGGSVRDFVSSSGPWEIYAEDVFDKEEVELSRVALTKSEKVRESNKKLLREYEEAIEKQSRATERMWESWYSCRDKKTRLTRVINTFDEYRRMAGDDQLALKFLAKVFSKAEIIDAVDWFNREVPHEWLVSIAMLGPDKEDKSSDDDAHTPF